MATIFVQLAVGGNKSIGYLYIKYSVKLCLLLFNKCSLMGISTQDIENFKKFKEFILFVTEMYTKREGRYPIFWN